MTRSVTLALHGGEPIRKNKMPSRRALWDGEVAMINQVISYYRERDEDPPYSGWFEQEFCRKFAEFQGGGYADAVTSGTAATYVGLAALDLPARSEVIISPVTDSGPLNAIIHLGLTPVISDSRPGSYNMGPEQFLEVVTERTSAILATHSAGEPLHDLDVLVTEAHRRGIKVLEDCSQAPGARWKGERVGTYGDIAAFSTMYRKTLASGGNGGLVFTRNHDLHRRGVALADRGKPIWRTDLDLRDPSHTLFPALNFSTNEISCAIGIASLGRLQEAVDQRLAWTKKLCQELRARSRVCTPYALNDDFSVFYFPIFVDESRITCSKTDFAKAVKAEGIGLGEHYGCVISSCQWAEKYCSGSFIAKNALDTSYRSFNLYVNERYGDQEIDDTIEAICKVENYYA